MAGEAWPQENISDEQLKERLAVLGLPEDKLDWAVARIRPEDRPNYFIPNPTVDKLLDAIEQLPQSYDF
jgi:hypothetical protein